MLFMPLQKVEGWKSIKYEVRPEFGSLINEQDEEGNTPMYLAAINGHYKIVDKLKHCTGIHYSI